MDNKYAKLLIIFVAILLAVVILYLVLGNNEGNNLYNQNQKIYIEDEKNILTFLDKDLTGYTAKLTVRKDNCEASGENKIYTDTKYIQNVIINIASIQVVEKINEIISTEETTVLIFENKEGHSEVIRLQGDKLPTDKGQYLLSNTDNLEKLLEI